MNNGLGLSQLNCRKGFTLIELLVVIAIIAILAAILFPVFAKAKDSAAETACASNLKQLGSAFRMYMDDWNTAVPPQAVGCPTWGTPTASAPFKGWAEKLYKYHKKLGIYKCPRRKVNFAYSYNGNLDSNRVINPARPSQLITIFEVPGSGSGAILPSTNLRDTGNTDQTNEGQNDGEVYGVDNSGNALRKMEPGNLFKNYETFVINDDIVNKITLKTHFHSRMLFPGPHNGRNLVMFYDGHVKSLSGWTYGAMTFVP